MGLNRVYPYQLKSAAISLGIRALQEESIGNDQPTSINY